MSPGRIGGTFDVTDPQLYKNAAGAYSEGKKDAKRLYRKARNLNRSLKKTARKFKNPAEQRKQINKQQL